MKQFLVNQKCHTGLNLSLLGEDFHYLCHVRRHKKNHSFPVRDLNGVCFNAILVNITVKSCDLLIQDEIVFHSRHYGIELYCCLPKGKKMDSVIRQATEAGATKIIPLFSDHSLIQYQNEGDIEKKHARWSKIIKEALQQSGSNITTSLMAPFRIKDLPVTAENDAAYYCHQDYVRENTLSDLFQKNPETIKILIGPEGGLSKNEIQLLEEKKFSPLFLGSNVLRTETACLFAISSIITVMELI